MRIVAIRALHDAFIHAVFEGHVELRAHWSVAVVTKRRLRFGKQVLLRPGTVDRMAVGAYDIVQRVLRTAYLRPREVFPMTCEAVVENLLRLQFGERDDSRFAAARLNVSLARPVTAFTTSLFGWLIARRTTAEMRILVESGPLQGMARTADIATDIPARGGLWRRLKRA